MLVQTGNRDLVFVREEKQTQYTEGPWTVKPFARKRSEVLSVGPEINGIQRCIAAIHGNPREANARLIAAAPDLLETLKKCEEHVQEDQLNGVSFEDCADMLDIIRAAVAKATQP